MQSRESPIIPIVIILVSWGYSTFSHVSTSCHVILPASTAAPPGSSAREASLPRLSPHCPDIPEIVVRSCWQGKCYLSRGAFGLAQGNQGNRPTLQEAHRGRRTNACAFPVAGCEWGDYNDCEGNPFRDSNSGCLAPVPAHGFRKLVGRERRWLVRGNRLQAF